MIDRYSVSSYRLMDCSTSARYLSGPRDDCGIMDYPTSFPSTDYDKIPDTMSEPEKKEWRKKIDKKWKERITEVNKIVSNFKIIR